MKAIVFTRHGSPDILQLKEVEKPLLKENQLLIRVHAAALNALDSHLTRGLPYVARLIDGLVKPKPKIPGVDLAGRVEAIGSAVTKFQVGDEVFGSGYGAFAEYAITLERAVVLKPATVTFEMAAAVPVAGLTALQGLRDYGEIKSGQKVLIHGAGGGVGTFAVQIAKSFGAEVTAVCSTRNLDMVRSIGADHVIDYTQQDFTRSGPDGPDSYRDRERYDLIMAINGYHPISAFRRALNPSGIFVMAGAAKSKIFSAMFQALLVGPLITLTSNQKFRFFIARIRGEDLLFLSRLLESGGLKPVIDRHYPLSEAANAIRYLEEWHARGKVIIRVVQ